ncbi:hydroxyisourate hydrolase [Phreatobacter stygius]|uniref:5-hydroxyisourate hydrolase n=1 Tax=Phreatobacter stygius TaxID=1940610 RepID=A0A4D7B6N3_9HYPH|nr:hydroxyisourate hydrolase [Phreatobacter stygius]QCI66038.1 hydroxyisourate hydrolase [Phreatobacter stygius]
MGRLSTHVLDTVAGRPAAGMDVALYRLAEDGARALITKARTGEDGRTAEPLLAGAALVAGTYELVFGVAAYFRAAGAAQADPPFLDDVPIRFTIGDAQAHYHVPLIATPWSYQTYRGS